MTKGLRKYGMIGLASLLLLSFSLGIGDMAVLHLILIKSLPLGPQKFHNVNFKINFDANGPSPI